MKNFFFKLLIIFTIINSCKTADINTPAVTPEALTPLFSISKTTPKLNETITLKDESKGNPADERK
jgi:hypothetical protein